MKLKIAVTTFFLFLVFSLSGQNKLRYDGYYYHFQGDSVFNAFRYFLRFYDDGTVITVTTAGNPENLKKWFNKDFKTVAKGKYTLKESNLIFFIKSENGEVQYNGTINLENRLLLNVKSLINKYESREEYFFMKMDGLL